MSRLVPRLDGLPTTYWYLWAGTLVNRSGSFVVPFLALYLTRERHTPLGEVGLVVAAWGAGSTCAGLAGGFVADRFGRRAGMLLSLIAGAFAMVTLAFARGTPQITAAVLALGLLGEMFRPAVLAAVGDVIRPEDRTRAFGLLYWSVNLGCAIAPLFASLLAKSFTLLFIVDAASSIAFALLIWLRVPETLPREDRASELASASSVSSSRHWLTPYTDKPYVVFIVISLLITIVFVQHMVGMPVDMSAHGIDAEQYGRIAATNGIVVVVVQPWAASWLGRFARERVMAAGAFLIALGFGLMAFAHTPLQYAGTIAMWSLGEIALLPLASAVVDEFAPPDLRGSYQGVYQLVWGIALTLGPIVATRIIPRYGTTALWAGCFTAGTLAASGHLLRGVVRRRRREDLARVAA